jgi:hypothetical protein
MFCTSQHSGRIHLSIYTDTHRKLFLQMKQNLVLDSHTVPVVFILSLLLQGTPISQRVTEATQATWGFLLLLHFSQQFLKGNEQC